MYLVCSSQDPIPAKITDAINNLRVPISAVGEISAVQNEVR